jgi:type II secretory pathway pseudopilin PulG
MVIMIVGILAAVSIPMVSGNVERARWTEAIQTLGVIKRTLKLYRLQHGAPPWKRLNGAAPSAVIPKMIADIGVPGPNADGRYVYCIAQAASFPTVAYAFHDINGDGVQAGDPIVWIRDNGTFVSANGAPQF